MNKQVPKRILLIRLQAVGDVVITFPFVQLLKNTYPDTQIDYLTRPAQSALVANLTAVTTVIPFTDAFDRLSQGVGLLRVLLVLLGKRYDMVVDLQANRLTRTICRVLFANRFVAFERFTPFTAADRYWKAFCQIGLLASFEHPKLLVKNTKTGLSILVEHGWTKKTDLVILNPAGAFASRNWPLENYYEFAQRWLTHYADTTFLLLGTEKIQEKAGYLSDRLRGQVINLVGKTSLEEAFQIIGYTKLMVSEDSGLMHIAWALKIPTIALIGSTDKHRSAQNGVLIRSLHSDDLPCGNCMKPICQFGKTPYCLSRYSPAMIVDIGRHLLSVA